MHLILNRRIAVQNNSTSSSNLGRGGALPQAPADLIKLYLSPKRPTTPWFQVNPVIQEIRRQIEEDPMKSVDYARILLHRYRQSVNRKRSDSLNGLEVLIKALPPTPFAICYFAKTQVLFAFFPLEGRAKVYSGSRITGRLYDIRDPNVQAIYHTQNCVYQSDADHIKEALLHERKVNAIFDRLVDQQAVRLKEGLPVPQLPELAYKLIGFGRRAYKGLERGTVSPNAPFWKHSMVLGDYHVVLLTRIEKGLFDIKSDPEIGKFIAKKLLPLMVYHTSEQRPISMAIVQDRFPKEARNIIIQNLSLLKDEEAQCNIATGILNWNYDKDQEFLINLVSKIENPRALEILVDGVISKSANVPRYKALNKALIDAVLNRFTPVEGISFLRDANLLSETRLDELLKNNFDGFSSSETSSPVSAFARDFGAFVSGFYRCKAQDLNLRTALTIVSKYLYIFEQIPNRRDIESHIDRFALVNGFPSRYTPTYARNAFSNWQMECQRKQQEAERAWIKEAEAKRVKEAEDRAKAAAEALARELAKPEWQRAQERREAEAAEAAAATRLAEEERARRQEEVDRDRLMQERIAWTQREQLHRWQCEREGRNPYIEPVFPI